MEHRITEYGPGKVSFVHGPLPKPRTRVTLSWIARAAAAIPSRHTRVATLRCRVTLTRIRVNLAVPCVCVTCTNVR